MRMLSSLRSLGGNTNRSRSLYVLLFTLGIGGIFKAAAFWRETYIAAHYGVSADTDIYFGLQQIPMAILTFTLGLSGWRLPLPTHEPGKPRKDPAGRGGFWLSRCYWAWLVRPSRCSPNLFFWRRSMRKIRRRLI